LVPGLSRR